MARSKAKSPAVVESARRWYPQQVKWRRHLHEYPEVANQEFKTTSFLKKELRQLGLKLRTFNLPTGVVADLKGARSGPTVAIRSDIDALPVQEQTELPFASRLAGMMHACGHDVHMATVLGTAAALSDLREELAGQVRFLFQPAEEEPPGGAERMVKAGVLKGVDTIFGLHVDPSLPVGSIGLCDGPMMAQVCDFDITIKGRGSHAARPHLSVDAVVTSAAVVEALQKIVSRYTDPTIPLVLTIGRISGGTARNVIADRVSLVCTARTLSPLVSRRLPSLIRRTATGVCRAHGATSEIKAVASYPMLVNDMATNRLYEQVFGDLFDRRRVKRTSPVLGGEDFAYFLQKVPGAMFRLGAGNKKIGADKPWHSSKFIVDENAMLYGTALLAEAVLQYGRDHAK
jgi:amidohydrolase